MFLSYSTEVDRDILDHSGKKALEYQHINRTVSDSTFSSKYKLHEPPRSENSMTFPRGDPLAVKKQRRRHLTTPVQRSISMLLGANKPNKVESNNNKVESEEYDTVSLRGGELKRNEKRSKSFLRKSFRPTKKTVRDTPDIFE